MPHRFLCSAPLRLACSPVPRAWRSASIMALVALCTSACDPEAGSDAGRTAPLDAGSIDDAGDHDVTDAGRGDGGAPGTSIVAVSGMPCAEDNKVGRIFVGETYGNWLIAGSVSNAVPQFNGLPQVTAGDCGNYAPTGCPNGCSADAVCLYDGTCGPQPFTRGDVSFVLRADNSVIAQGSANAVTGEVTATLTPDDVMGAPLTLSLVLDDEAGGPVTVAFAGQLPAAFGAGDPSYTDLAPNPWDSGDIVMNWTATGEDSVFMRTQMLPNHHAGVAVTECLVEDSAGEVTVDTTLADALRLETGLEGNGYGLRHRVASATLPSGGCVEAVFGYQATWSF